MIIDFHTHIFPDRIAEKAVAKLASVIHLVPEINGCAGELLKNMEQSGVDISVVLPVITGIRQFDSILRFASAINEEFHDHATGRLFSLAGIHPDDPDCMLHLELIAAEGFAGIKIHPNHQGVVFHDIRYKRLLSKASDLGLLIVTHTGFDPYTPEEDFCTPDMILEVLQDVAPEKLVLAHMGNNINYDEAEEKLCGQNVYFDTAYSLSTMDLNQFTRMVRKHGADKILFASDCPWSSPKKCVDLLNNTDLSSEEKELIFHTNAEKLLPL